MGLRVDTTAHFVAVSVFAHGILAATLNIIVKILAVTLPIVIWMYCTSNSIFQLLQPNKPVSPEYQASDQQISQHI